jgi:hypothetical protein
MGYGGPALSRHLCQTTHTWTEHCLRTMSPVAQHPEQRPTDLLYRNLSGRQPEIVVAAQGSYLTLDDGRQ